MQFLLGLIRPLKRLRFFGASSVYVYVIIVTREIVALVIYALGRYMRENRSYDLMLGLLSPKIFI